MTSFDASRATLSQTDMFEPFYVQSTRSLRGAVDRGDVTTDTPVLAVEHVGGTVALRAGTGAVFEIRLEAKDA